LVKRVLRETEKRLKSEKWRKGKEEEQGQRLEKRKAWSLEIAGLTQVRGVYRRLMGIMG
jgi:hypothetical protein